MSLYYVLNTKDPNVYTFTHASQRPCIIRSLNELNTGTFTQLAINSVKESSTICGYPAYTYKGTEWFYALYELPDGYHCSTFVDCLEYYCNGDFQTLTEVLCSSYFIKHSTAVYIMSNTNLVALHVNYISKTLQLHSRATNNTVRNFRDLHESCNCESLLYKIDEEYIDSIYWGTSMFQFSQGH